MTTATTTRLLIAILVACAAISSPAPADEPASLVDELLKKGFNTLVGAISKSDLPAKFEAGKQYTIVGPNDVAFRNLPKAELDALMGDKAKLTQVLSGHIIAGKVTSEELKTGKFTTLAGTTLEGKFIDGKIKVNSATVVKPDVVAINGLIHGIDQVFLK